MQPPQRHLHSSAAVYTSAPPLVISTTTALHRDRTLEMIGSLGIFAPAQRVVAPPAPLPACNRSYLKRNGGLIISALHAAAWTRIVESNTTTAIFEDDVEVDSAKRARTRLLELARASSSSPSPCDLLLLGHCSNLGRGRCTHAYVASPRAAALLLGHLSARDGCALASEVHRAFCDRLDVCCTTAKGSPGKLLFGSGIVGKDRAMPGMAIRAGSPSSPSSSSSSSPSSSSSSPSGVGMVAAPYIIAFPGRFERAASIVRSIGLFPPPTRVHPPIPPALCRERADGLRTGSDSSRGSDSSSSSSRAANLPASKASAAPPPLTRGILSLAAAHARAWQLIVDSNATAAVFEDDIEASRPAGGPKPQRS